MYQSYDSHVTLTSYLSKYDPKLILGTTPKSLYKSYYCLFHPGTDIVPNLERIMQNIKTILVSMNKVKVARGCMIDKLSSSGRQYEIQNKVVICKKTLGDSRQKKT